MMTLVSLPTMVTPSGWKRFQKSTLSCITISMNFKCSRGQFIKLAIFIKWTTHPTSEVAFIRAIYSLA